MEFEIKKINECERSLEFSIPATEVNKKIESLYSEYQASAKLDGFRKGKVPMNIIKSKYSATIQEEAINECIRETYRGIAEKEKISPVSDIRLEDKKFDPAKELKVKLSYEIMPDLKLQHYKGIKIKKLSTEVTEKEIEMVMSKLTDSKATYVPTAMRAASSEDMLIVSYDILWEEKGVYRKNHVSNYTVLMDAPETPEEIRNALKNTVPGDKKTVKIKYPPDHKDENLRDKSVEYAFVVHEIKEKRLPPIDDEFAKNIGFKSMEELKTNITTSIARDKETEARSRMRTQIINSLIDSNPFKPLNSLVADYMESMLKQAGKNIDDKTKSQLEEIAIWRAKRDMILQQLSEVEHIEITAEELKAKLLDTEEGRKLGYEKLVKDLQKKGIFSSIVWEFTVDKTMNFLIENAEISPE
ncbi:MAG: trigger factor [bacterium]|nr:trigger factor [bacterium]